MTREIIFSSENLKVVDRPEDGETVILTFSPLGFTVVGDSFWGAELFDRVNLSAIGFVATSANWFPPDDMEAAFPAVRARIAGRKVITYGHSQGAYAALKFAKQLGARTAVAFSPQWSINPSDVKAFDRRYEKNYDPNLRNGERIDEGDLCRQSFVIVDRADKEDVVHADILAKLSGVTCIPSPFSGHNTIVPVAEGGQGRPLMHLFTKSDGIQASDIRQLLRNARRKSDTYRRTRIDQLLEHLPRHQKIYEIALSAIPDGAEKTMTKVLGQVAAAQMQAAAVTMAEVSDEALAKFNLFRFWTAFRRAGFDVGERRIAPIFKFAHANSVFARLHGVTSMIKFGLSGEALEELSALSADPNADSCRRFFLDHYNRLDRMDLASAFLDKLFECGQITLERRLEEGIRVAGTLRARNRSADATYELMALYRLCKGDLHKTLELTGAALEYGLFGFAKEMLARFTSIPNPPPLALIYQVHFQSQEDLSEARKRLTALTKSRFTDVAFWQNLSKLAERMGMPSAALEAAQKSFEVSGEAFSERKRLAQVLTANGKHRLSLRHLRVLADAPEAVGESAERLAELSLASGDAKLAINFAKLWLSAAPENSGANILLCKMLLKDGDLRGAVAAMDSFARRIEGGLKLDREQFSKALDAARNVGGGADDRIAELAAARFPGDPAFRTVTTSGSLFKSFPVPSRDTNGLSSATKKGLLARFGISRIA